jgi:hypothetical protein
MGTKHKQPEVLDEMIEHIRYELLKIVDFIKFSNGWCWLLTPELMKFTSESILEAALLHFRCLIEFLADEPKSDQVMARDYVKGWDWKISDQLVQVGDLHGRIAHLGVVRQSVATRGDFSWLDWLNTQAPSVLSAFRDFLTRLREESPKRYDLFRQPRPGLPVIEVLPLLDSLLEIPSAPGREQLR